jgi:hypothetical protein
MLRHYSFFFRNTFTHTKDLYSNIYTSLSTPTNYNNNKREYICHVNFLFDIIVVLNNALW